MQNLNGKDRVFETKLQMSAICDIHEIPVRIYRWHGGRRSIVKENEKAEVMSIYYAVA
jgi:hypothetical protein